MKRMLLIFCIFSSFLFGCKFEEKIENKTYLEINNQTKFVTNIYFNIPSNDSLWLKVPAGETIKKEISPSLHKTGDIVYIEYEYVLIDDVVFSYYNPTSIDCNKDLRIYKNVVNTINITNIKIDIQETFLIIQNNSGNPTRLYNETGEPIKPYKTKTDDAWIQNSSNAVFQANDINIKDYCIGSNISPVKLETEINLKKGFIYYFTYTGETCELTSISHLDGTSHSFEYQTNDEYHWGTCACGFTEEKKEHSFSQQRDSSFHWFACVCGQEREKETHIFNQENDDKYHWEICNCGYIINETEHSIESQKYIISDDEYHMGTCSCGFIKSENHLFYINHDNEYHWNVCEKCGHNTNPIKHTMRWVNSGKNFRKCTECSFQKIAEDNTFVIYSVSDLKNITKNDSPNSIFELANDIDGNNEIWIPIDTLKGTLIGNGYSIKNFHIIDGSKLQDNMRAYSGFFYKNAGVIKNIIFKNIIINTIFTYQTSEQRHIMVGLVAGSNNDTGEIRNVHLENITIVSKISQTIDQSGYDVSQMNISGGIVGKNMGNINHCSIRKSSISVYTDAKKNCCNSIIYAGGICGENANKCSNVLSMDTTLIANAKGGYDCKWREDGTFKCYAGNIFGINYGNGEKMLSYNNQTPQVKIDNNNCDNTKNEIIYEKNESNIIDLYTINNVTDFNSYSSIINGWEHWSITASGPENYIDM